MARENAKEQGMAWTGLRRRPLAARIMLELAGRAPCGGLRIDLPDGSVEHVEGRRAGPRAHIRVHDYRVVRRLLTGGDTAFLEAYMDGDWDSPDLATLLEWGAVNEAYFSNLTVGRWRVRLMHRLMHLLRGNSRAGSRRNIARHYDLGNDFYRLWLDPSMTYSSGVYEAAGDDLEQAQQNKYRRLLELLRLDAGDHLLEIGSGWGGFALYAARHAGCRVTSITVSAEQLRVARERAVEAGLDDRVEFRFQDYRDVTGRFDRIVSIEMFEAVGERYWPRFFDVLHQRLVPGGRAVLQVITIDERAFDNYRSKADFIQRYIFPGGMLPSPRAFYDHARAAGLTAQPGRFFGQHYARTLADWETRFAAAEDAVKGMGFPDQFVRMWRAYLAYCQAGFRSGRIDLLQAVLTR